MNKVKFVLVGIFMSCLSIPNTNAQQYFKVDITSGNLLTGFAGLGAAYLINNSRDGFVVDNYVTWNVFPARRLRADAVMNTNHNRPYDISTATPNFLDSYYKFPEILNGLGTGLKWGFSKEFNSFINEIAAYGSLHLTYSYFELDMVEYTDSHPISVVNSGCYGNSIIRATPGIGALVMLGNPEGNVSFKLDVNIRYDIPVFYKGEFGSGAGCLKSGFSPRISLTAVGPWFIKKHLGMNIGVFYEFMTYEWFKTSEYFGEPFMKGGTFGINFTMFPERISGYRKHTQSK